MGVDKLYIAKSTAGVHNKLTILYMIGKSLVLGQCHHVYIVEQKLATPWNFLNLTFFYFIS